MSGGARIAVAGATGALGSELLAVLSESSLAVEELVPVATDRSLGRELEFRGESLPVETELPDLRELDLLFLCTPAGAALDLARSALRAELACIDATGTLAGSNDVPLVVAALHAPPPADEATLVATPPGAALAWALVLAPLAAAGGGIARISGVALEAASWRGRQGIESLYQESIAIFNQAELPAPEVFARPVAFDCLPALGELTESGATEREVQLARTVARLLGGAPRIAATLVQVPAFVGFGAALAVETLRELDPKEALAALAAAPGVEVWTREPSGLTLRAVAGRDRVLVSRIRRDPCNGGLLLWIASDVLRLAAANAVEVAAARLRQGP